VASTLLRWLCISLHDVSVVVSGYVGGLWEGQWACF